MNFFFSILVFIISLVFVNDNNLDDQSWRVRRENVLVCYICCWRWNKMCESVKSWGKGRLLEIIKAQVYFLISDSTCWSTEPTRFPGLLLSDCTLSPRAPAYPHQILNLTQTSQFIPYTLHLYSSEVFIKVSVMKMLLWQPNNVFLSRHPHAAV